MKADVEEMMNEYIMQTQNINDEIEGTANDSRDEAYECCIYMCCLACMNM